MPNLFINKELMFLSELPIEINRALPSIQKISCENIVKIRSFMNRKSEE